MSQDKTKECLLKSARALFARLGFAATSVKQIAESAKVNISLVSYHFGGKEGLYKACLENETENLRNYFDQRIASFSSKEEFKFKLKLFIEDVVNRSLEHREVSRIIRRDIEMDPIDPALLDVFKKTIIPMFERLIQFLQKGQDAGYLRSDLDAKQMSVLFMGGIQHTIRTDHLRKRLFGVSLQDAKERESLINTAIEMFFVGTENKEGTT